MERLVVQGGATLSGEIHISGAKNAALPILTAALLSDSPCVVQNVPHLQDITTAFELFSCLGVRATFDEDMNVEVDTRHVSSFESPHDLVRTMRASILTLGPLLGRYGQARVSFPGGCAIGNRPIDLHLSGLSALGASVEVRDGYIEARSEGRLKGAKITFDKVTVGGTENIMMAAVLAKGETIIENAAKEPEVVDLACFLNKMGGKIEGAGESRIVVHGVSSLGGCTHKIMPDRIEAGTYLTAVTTVGGSVCLRSTDPSALDIVLCKLDEAGAELQVGDDWIEVTMERERPRSVDVETAPYPGFPTDMQAQITAMNAVADGVGRVTETIFENRLIQIREMQRMGADITVRGNTAIVRGTESLVGTQVAANDLRASASLVIAGLVASGETEIHDIHHIDRGYERIEEKLQKLGAKIRRLSLLQPA